MVHVINCFRPLFVTHTEPVRVYVRSYLVVLLLGCRRHQRGGAPGDGRSRLVHVVAWGGLGGGGGCCGGGSTSKRKRDTSKHAWCNRLGGGGAGQAKTIKSAIQHAWMLSEIWLQRRWIKRAAAVTQSRSSPLTLDVFRALTQQACMQQEHRRLVQLKADAACAH